MSWKVLEGGNCARSAPTLRYSAKLDLTDGPKVAMFFGLFQSGIDE